MLESKIQSKIIKRLESEGWLCVKLIKTNKNGIPDLVCFKDGKSMFIEVKREEGILSELQKYRIDEIRKKGIETRVWTEYNKDFQEQKQ
jgi:Holliday junction resolvase